MLDVPHHLVLLRKAVVHLFPNVCPVLFELRPRAVLKGFYPVILALDLSCDAGIELGLPG